VRAPTVSFAGKLKRFGLVLPGYFGRQSAQPLEEAASRPRATLGIVENIQKLGARRQSSKGKRVKPTDKSKCGLRIENKNRPSFHSSFRIHHLILLRVVLFAVTAAGRCALGATEIACKLP
jgi:hypothetical protein